MNSGDCGKADSEESALAAPFATARFSRSFRDALSGRRVGEPRAFVPLNTPANIAPLVRQPLSGSRLPGSCRNALGSTPLVGPRPQQPAANTHGRYFELAVGQDRK